MSQGAHGSSSLPGAAELHRHISADEAAELTAALVRIETVVEAGRTEAPVAELVNSWCRDEGLTARLQEVSPGRPNLIVDIPGDRPGPTILFEGHSDTVTAGNPDEWTYGPFNPVRVGDRLYGRGSCDTKGNMAAAYLAVRAVARATGGSFPGHIRFLVPIDEENMMTGIKHFIASGGADDLDGAVACEPENLEICIRQKGALRLQAIVRGRMAHGAMPLTGLNPLPLLAQMALAAGEVERSEQARVGLDPYLGWPSVTPTELTAPEKGPSGFNVVPAAGRMSLDLRTVVGQDHGVLERDLRARLEAIIEAANKDLRAGQGGMLRRRLDPNLDPGLYRGELVRIDDRPVTHTERDHPLAQAFAGAVEGVTGRPAVYSGVPGATDATFLWAAGVPIVTTGAGERFVPHHVDEWVGVEQLGQAALLYAQGALRFLASGYRRSREVPQ